MGMSGDIYAQPLYWHQSGSERGLIIAPTEDDLVYALDAATGRTVWCANLGHAVPRAALPCGNIDPLGVTGTQVIDTLRGAVYLDAMVDDRGTLRMPASSHRAIGCLPPFFRLGHISRVGH